MKKINDKLSRRALPAVLFTIFLNMLGTGILIPVIPQLLANPESPHYLLPDGWTFAGGLVLLAWLTAIFPLMQFIATPIMGQLSDRYGRKKVLAISLFGTSLGYVLFAIGILTKNLPLMFFSRALDGITGGNISVAQAVIADVTPPEKRTRIFGLMGAMIGLGIVMGPYIGAKLASPGINFFGLTTPDWFQPATPFWFAAILSLVNALLVLFILPETHKLINKHLKLKFNQSIRYIVTAATHPALRTIFPSVFLYFGGLTVFFAFFQVLLINKLHFSTTNVGDFFAYVGIWIAIAQLTVTPFLAKRFKNYQILRVSMFFTGLVLFGFLAADNVAQLLIIVPFFALGNAQFLANNTSLVSNSVGPEIQGEALGINASVQALAQSIPTIIGGYIAVTGINTPILTGGVLMLLAGAMFWLLYKPSRQIVHQDILAVSER